MKEFLKMTGATIVGFLIVSAISTIISLMAFMAIILQSTSSDTAKIDDDTVMKVTLSGTVSERAKSDDFAAFMSAIGEATNEIGLDELRTAFLKAASDDKVKAVYLECGALGATPAQIEEIREMISKFKKSDKPVYAYADQYTQGSYWAAADADIKWLNPSGQVIMAGMTSNTMFMKRALDKLGVEMQIFKVGTFKSAVEPYFLTEMSDANRAQMQQFNDVIWEKMKADINNPNIQEFADKGMFFDNASKTVEMGFIDSLVYKIDVKNLIEEELSDDIDFETYKTINKAISLPASSTHQIAVLYAEGAIDGGDIEGISSEKIVKELEKLRKNDKVKAVVLRIHSPGGSAYGSEQMWYAAEKLRKEKPLIVSMSGYAASGGYYMACNADTIVAQHTTLTGSIGIFGTFPNAEGLVNKIGLDFDGVKTAEYADFGTMTRPMNNGEKAILQNYINAGYELFTKRCAEGRGMDIDDLKAVAEGRVWTGYDAKKLGLIDEIGGLDRAIEIAANAAGLANYKVRSYPKKKNMMEELLKNLTEETQMRILSNKIGVASQYIPLYEQIMNMRGAQALMPYVINVN